jgi:hypothetical protein
MVDLSIDTALVMVAAARTLRATLNYIRGVLN